MGDAIYAIINNLVYLVYTTRYMLDFEALRSAGGFRGPPATLAHHTQGCKKELNKMRRYEADREVHVFLIIFLANWRPANAKGSMARENNPDASCMSMTK